MLASVAAVAMVSSTVALILFSLLILNSEKNKQTKLETHPNHLKSPETNIVLIVLINICLMVENIPSLLVNQELFIDYFL